MSELKIERKYKVGDRVVFYTSKASDRPTIEATIRSINEDNSSYPYEVSEQIEDNPGYILAEDSSNAESWYIIAKVGEEKVAKCATEDCGCERPEEPELREPRNFNPEELKVGDRVRYQRFNHDTGVTCISTGKLVDELSDFYEYDFEVTDDDSRSTWHIFRSEEAAKENPDGFREQWFVTEMIEASKEAPKEASGKPEWMQEAEKMMGDKIGIIGELSKLKESVYENHFREVWLNFLRDQIDPENGDYDTSYEADEIARGADNLLAEYKKRFFKDEKGSEEK